MALWYTVFEACDQKAWNPIRSSKLCRKVGHHTEDLLSYLSIFLAIKRKQPKKLVQKLIVMTVNTQILPTPVQGGSGYLETIIKELSKLWSSSWGDGRRRVKQEHDLIYFNFLHFSRYLLSPNYHQRQTTVWLEEFIMWVSLIFQ